VTPGARYTLAGRPGAWRYLGQATYVDEHTGAEVEHDHVRMMRGDEEVWVDPREITGAYVGEAHGVFALGDDATIAG